jgi:hypothetical protein
LTTTVGRTRIGYSICGYDFYQPPHVRSRAEERVGRTDHPLDRRDPTSPRLRNQPADEQRSGGQLKFHIASLYPLLYRLEERGWLLGRWVEKTGQRRRRYYRLTLEGRRVLASQRNTWRTFVAAMQLITGVDNA